MRRFMCVVMMCSWVFAGVVRGAGNSSASSARPRVVNIGSLYTYGTVIGRSAKPAIEAAVDDVNADSSILAGTKLKLIESDTNCSAFLGTLEGNAFPETPAIGFKLGFLFLLAAMAVNLEK